MGFFDDVTNAATGVFGGGAATGLLGGDMGGDGGGGIIGDLTGANAAKKAAAEEAAAANNATALQKYIYDTNRSDLSPYRAAGASALSDLQGQMPNLTKQFTMADFQADPGYQFNLQQGQQAIEKSAAARGGFSGATLKSLADYSQGLAGNEFNNAYNRFTGNQQQRYNMLSGLAGMGQTANGQSITSGTNYANQAGQNMMAVGNANAAATMQGYNGMMGLANLGVQGAKAAAMA